MCNAFIKCALRGKRCCINLFMASCHNLHDEHKQTNKNPTIYKNLFCTTIKAYRCCFMCFYLHFFLLYVTNFFKPNKMLNSKFSVDYIGNGNNTGKCNKMDLAIFIFCYFDVVISSCLSERNKSKFTNFGMENSSHAIFFPVFIFITHILFLCFVCK